MSGPGRLESLPARAAAAAAIAVAAAVPYLQVLDAPFVFDDVKLVKENRHLKAGFEDPSLILETFDITSKKWEDEELRPNYRPLRFLSYLGDYALSRWLRPGFAEGDPPPFFFHLTNVLLHAACALLVAFVSRRLAEEIGGSLGPARNAARLVGLLAGLLFALHPLATEAVAYVSGRRDVLSTALFLAGLAVYLLPGPGGRPGRIAIIAVPALFAAALLAKEMVVTFPAVLLLVDLARRVRWSAGRVAIHVVSWAVALGFAALTVANKALIVAVPVVADRPLIAAASTAFSGSTLLTASRYVARYLALALLPLSQSIDYSFDAIPPSRSLLAPWTTLPAAALVLALIAAGTAFLLRSTRGRARSPWEPALAVGLLWFLGTLVPVLQLVPIAERFAERFAYLPLVGLAFAAAFALDRLRRFEHLLGWGLAAGISAALLGGAFARGGDWKSPLALWTSAVKSQPRAARAHLGRANALKDLGAPSGAAGLLREAADEYTRAIEIFDEAPDVPLHHGFILQALTLRGGTLGALSASDPSALGRAIADYERVLGMKDTDGTVIESSPKHTVLHFDLAGLLLRTGRRDDSAREYQRVLELGTPAALVSAAHYYLGKIALAGGDPKGARAAYEKALDTMPAGDPAHGAVSLDLADLLIETRDLDEAQTAVRRALEAGAAGKVRLALLMRDAKARDRRGDLSGCAEALERIIAEDGTYVPALLTLAGIETSRGGYDAAEARYAKALQVEPGNEEARRGLETVKVLRGAGSGGEPPREEAGKVLEAVEKKAAEALKDGAFPAAREAYMNLLARATEAKRTSAQLTALRGLAMAEARLGRTKTGEKHIQTALDLAPSDPETLRVHGDLAFLDADYATARRRYERWLEALPAGATADPVSRARLAESIGESDPRLALEHLRKAKAAGLDDPAADRQEGYYLAAAGLWKESADAFQRYFDRTQGKEDPVRERAKDFVSRNVLPRLKE